MCSYQRIVEFDLIYDIDLLAMLTLIISKSSTMDTLNANAAPVISCNCICYLAIPTGLRAKTKTATFQPKPQLQQCILAATYISFVFESMATIFLHRNGCFSCHLDLGLEHSIECIRHICTHTHTSY